MEKTDVWNSEMIPRLNPNSSSSNILKAAKDESDSNEELDDNDEHMPV